MKKQWLLFLCLFTLLSCQDSAEELTQESVQEEELPIQEEPVETTEHRVEEEPPVQAVMETVPLVEVDLAIFSHQESNTRQQNTSLQRENIDLSATTVNYYQPGEIDTSLLSADDGEPLSIIDYGPVGDLPEEVRRPSIFIMFSKPMVPITNLGEPLLSHPYMTIEPHIEGQFYWYGTNLLSFEPYEALTTSEEGLSQEYRVTIKKDFPSLNGSLLSEGFTFSFYPEPLRIVSLKIPRLDTDGFYWNRNEIPFEEAHKVLLQFNMPVDPSSIASGMTVKAGSQEIPFFLEHPSNEEDPVKQAQSLTLTIPDSVSFSNAQNIKVTLREGTPAQPGAPVTEENIEQRYRTLSVYSFQGILRHCYAFPYRPDMVHYPVYLQFSHHVAPDQDLENLISTSLNIDLSGKVDYSQGYIRLYNLPLEAGDEFQISISSELKDIYGQSLQTVDERTVQIPIPNSYIRFPSITDRFTFRGSQAPRRGYLENEFAPRLLTEYLGLTQLRYGIHPLENGFISELRNPPENLEWVDVSLEDRDPYKTYFEDINLSDYLDENNNGTIEVFTEAVHPDRWSRNNESREFSDALVIQATNVGITVRYGYNRMLVWANTLSDGEPIANAQVVLTARGRKETTTDENGLGIIEFSSGEYLSMMTNLSSRNGAKITVISETERGEFEFKNTQNANRCGITSVAPPTTGISDKEYGLIFSDRKLYKPGETVTFRGMDWILSEGDYQPQSGRYRVVIHSRNRNNDYSVLTEGTLYLSSTGGFYGTLELTGDPEPGQYSLSFSRITTSNRRDHVAYQTGTTIQIANFRRLNFAVSSQIPERDYFEGDTVSSIVNASYLAGGAMPGAEYSYFWTRNSINYRPRDSRWTSYTFGVPVETPEKVLNQGSGNLSADGTATIQQLATGHENTSGTYQYIAETTVTDVDHQQVSSSASVLVHPASYYIGMHLGLESSWWTKFIKANQESSVSIALVTPDGELYPEGAEVTATLSKYSWRATYQQGVSSRMNVSYNREKEEISSEIVHIDETGTGIFSIYPETSGQYMLELNSTDREGRTVKTQLEFYAYGGGWFFRPTDTDMITLVQDKDVYSVGDTATLLVQSPLREGRYLLTIEREGIIEEEIISLDEETTTIEIPIKEEYIPRMYIALCSFSSREEVPENYYDNDLGKPRSFFGVTSIDISTRTRELDIEIVNNQENYRPGEEAEVYIRVTQNGEPVARAEVIFMAVDRGVIDLIDYHVPNPLDFFYDPSKFPLCTRGDDLRNYLLAPVTYDIESLQGGDGIKMDERNDFNPLACFIPSALTDENGVAKATFTLPDNLTTYRTTAIAVSDTAYIGFEEEEILVQNPINVRTSFARKLRYRDTSTGYVVVQNNQNTEQVVTISLASDLIATPGASEKTVTVQAGGIYSVPFLLISQGEGEAEIQITIQSDVLNEVITQPMTIERPFSQEYFATAGVTNTPIPESDGFYGEEGIILPSCMLPLSGSLTTETYTSRMNMLKTPIQYYKRYFRRYYYYIYDQVSYHFPEVIFGETIDELMGEQTYSITTIQSIINRLFRLQTSEGWIRYRSDQIRAYPYSDLNFMFFCLLAKQQGIEVPEASFNKLKEYLLTEWDRNYYHPATRAYLSYIFFMAGEDVTQITNSVMAQKDLLGVSARSLMVVNLINQDRREEAEQLWQETRNCFHFEARNIYFDEPRSCWWWRYDSEITKTALVAWASHVMEDPYEIQQKCIEALRYRLSLTSRPGYCGYRWALIAMKSYCESDHVDDLDLNARVLFNGEEIAQEHFNSIHQPSIWNTIDFDEENTAELPENTAIPLRFERKGTGNLYYSSLLSYSLPNEIVLPRNEGIGIYTQYETLDGEKIEPDALIAGTTYRVRSIISTNKNRNDMILEIPLPSGVELIDPSFATTSTYANEGGVTSELTTEYTRWGETRTYNADDYYMHFGPWWWYWRNIPQVQYYDNMISYFWDYFYTGNKEITFLVRATNPGIYPTPAAQAQLSITPEVFGRTGGTLFVVSEEQEE